VKERLADQRKTGQHGDHHQAGDTGHAQALLRRIARRHGKEGRHRCERIDNDEQRAEGQQGVFGERHAETCIRNSGGD
jgi:hypothetical protein